MSRTRQKNLGLEESLTTTSLTYHVGPSRHIDYETPPLTGLPLSSDVSSEEKEGVGYHSILRHEIKCTEHGTFTSHSDSFVDTEIFDVCRVIVDEYKRKRGDEVKSKWKSVRKELNVVGL